MWWAFWACWLEIHVHYSSFLVVWEWIKKSTNLHHECLIDRLICGVISAFLYMAGATGYLSINQWWISV
jgi:hypothetical protein